MTQLTRCQKKLALVFIASQSTSKSFEGAIVTTCQIVHYIHFL